MRKRETMGFGMVIFWATVLCLGAICFGETTELSTTYPNVSSLDQADYGYTAELPEPSVVGLLLAGLGGYCCLGRNRI